jgi:hypothetical protein
MLNCEATIDAVSKVAWLTCRLFEVVAQLPYPIVTNILSPAKFIFIGGILVETCNMPPSLKALG